MIDERLAHLYSQETLTAQPSVIREICSLVARPEVRSLAGGWPDPAVFPSREIGRIFAELLEHKAGPVLQYGSTEGLLELRELLAQRLALEGAKGLGPENVLLTHGSAQGMQLAAQVFINKGDTAAVGLPTYVGGPGSFHSRGAEMVGVPVDGDGLDMGRLEETGRRLKKEGRPIKALYLVPNFQNPTGSTLTLDRRQRLVQLAQELDFIIIEDDPYREIRFEGAYLPSLLALDKAGRVIHLGSTSKILTPGLRLGWAVGEAGIIGRMAQAKQYFDCATNTPAQYIFLEFLKRGLLAPRIKANIDHYRNKRDWMLAQLQRHFPPQVTWNRPLGGFFIFVHLPAAWNAMDLFYEAVASDVAFITGQSFFVDGSGANTLRLSFSQASKEDIEAAVAELGRLIRARLEKG